MFRITCSLASLVVIGACASGAPAPTFPEDDEPMPDEASVEAAHVKWCAALEKMGEEGRWSYKKECEAATPAASADFIERLAACFTKQLETHGSDAADGTTMLSTCTDEILYNIDPGELAQNPLVRMRCERTARCEKFPFDECLASFDRLEDFQRALFVSMYNLRAQKQIGTCMTTTACAADEDSAREKCYSEAFGKRVWTPF